MNKRMLAIFIAAALVVFPKTSKADLDVLSIAQDQITSITEKVGAIVKKYTQIQASLQELSLNRNIVSQLKDKVKSELKSRAMAFYGDLKDMAMAEGMAFLKTSLSSVSLPGVGQYIDLGGFINPKLTVAVGKTYLKKKHKKNDVQSTVAQDERSNNLMIDNLSVLFANSLVRRKQIIEEDPCSCVAEAGRDCSEEKQKCEDQEKEFNEMSDINVVKNKQYGVMLNANHRWLKIKEAVAMYAKMKGEAMMNQGNIDDISAITGEIEDEEEEDDTGEDAVQALMQNKINPLDLTNSVKDSLNKIKSGDYTGAFAGAMGTATDLYGNAPGSWDSVTKAMQEVTTGAGALNNAYHNAENGNWGGALNSALGGAGNIVGSTGNEGLGNIFNNAAGGAGNALNSALSGNWGAAIGNAAGGAGNAISGSGNDVLGSSIGAVGSLVNVGVNAANAGGNLGDIIDNTVGNSQAQGALNALYGAYDAQNTQNAAIVEAQQKAEEERNKKFEEMKKQQEEEMKKRKQAECKKCNEDNEALLKAGKPLSSLKSCIGVCM
ncbi:MAG: hypothetical protein IJ532_05070 [Alphaproteobacteria bacterium]|nr:hypothetical protein [Alphaproteobacteria bacterium]